LAKQQPLTKDIHQVLDTIAQTIYDKKGFNILALDVRGISSLADYVIIAEGNIDRHLKALTLAIKDSLFESGHEPLFVEGEGNGDWIVIDCSEIVIHLFVPEFREKYALEELWQDARIVDLKIDTDKQQLSLRRR
jgi:ribosome-associated protein